MAKKDAYYFPHDANALNDQKIMKLRMNMGMEGYGIWWAFLEMCRNENRGEHPYTIEKPTGKRLVSMACAIDENTAETFLITARACGLIVEENGRIFSPSFVERMSEIDASREQKRINGSKGGRPRKKPIGYDSVKQNESKTKALKERKGKERKVVNGAFDNFWDAYQKKTERKQAIAQWSKLSDSDRELALGAVGRYVESTPDPKYRKSAWRWLRDRRFEDKPILSQEQIEKKKQEGPENLQACLEALNGICEGTDETTTGTGCEETEADRARRRFDAGYAIGPTGTVPIGGDEIPEP